MPEILSAERPLPVGSIGRASLGWYGLLALIATEGALLSYSLFSYFYASVQAFGSLAAPDRPPLIFAVLMTAAAILNSISLIWALKSIRCDRRGQLTFAVGIAALLGLAFIGFEFADWVNKPFRPMSNAYASAYFALTAAHLAHVVAGTVMLFFLLVWSGLGYFNRYRNVPVLVIGGYWHFLNIAWIVYFLSVYAAPYFQYL